MTKGLCLMALLVPTSVLAQQGILPLSRVVDAPWTALMHRSDAAAHSALRPFFREDLVALPGADTLVPVAWKPWLGRITDPSHRWHGGPLIDALAGASLNQSEMAKYRAGAGGWLEWNATPLLTFGVDARAWSETLPSYLDRWSYATGVTPGEGFAHRSGESIMHYDWNAHADYKAGDYFHFTLGKGRNFFGEGYRSLLLSDEAYSYPYFKITTTAWHIRYVNLYTLMDDIQGIPEDSTRFAKKFTSMHYLSWNISKRVNVGLFEAIVWQDNDPKYPRGFDLSYVNPVIFYRPVEYGLGSPDNALLGAVLNVKVGRRTQLYSQVILDEFLLNHVRAGDGWYGNKQGVQVGGVAHDAFGMKGVMLRGELNYVRPFMYTHSDPRQNYAHHAQPLAHPYGSGFVEGLVQGEWRKGPWMVSNILSWTVMGQDTSFDINSNYGNNIFISDTERPLSADGTTLRSNGFRVGDPSEATVVQNEFRAARLLESRSGLMLEFAWTFRSETSDHAPARMANYLRLGISTHFRDRHPFQTVR